MPTQFISCAFKIHNPSRRKREILDRVFQEYTETMDWLLKWSKSNIDRIRLDGRYIPDKKKPERYKFTDKSIAPLLPKSSELPATIMSSAIKEALISNTAAALASYLALEDKGQQEAGFPECRGPHPEQYPHILDEFINLYLENMVDTHPAEALRQENEKRYQLLKVIKAGVMPIHFSRSRDFALLLQDDGKRFFLWMKLLSREASENKTVIHDGNMINLATGKLFEYNGSSGIVFPLEMGQRGGEWHWQYKRFIEPVLNGYGKVRAAKLIKQDEEYFLYISFEMEAAEPYEPVAYLGVNRGIIHSLGWGVVDLNGRILATGHSEDPFREIQERAKKRVRNKQKRFAKITKHDYSGQELDNIIHHVVNEVLKVARQYQAALVLEDWSLINASAFYRSAYTKINQIIEYKANLAGVPVVKRRMWGAYASQICIHCGQGLSREKGSRETICISCGKHEHVDEVNGVNIARRMFYKKEQWGGTEDQAGNWRLFHCGFANDDDSGTKFDLRKETAENIQDVVI